MNIDFSLANVDGLFPSNFSEEQLARAKTVFFKTLSLSVHRFYGGTMMTIPRAWFGGLAWLNVLYTPGVAKISTTIRDDPDESFNLSNRSNLVAVVSDSTRVLGDGDCGPSGGLGVMNGKAFIMNYYGGLNAFALCIDSRDKNGKHNPDKIIDFVKMLEPTVGAINLEDISQPDCFKVLRVLRKECNIPVWHDDAQGTACVTVAGLINALKVSGKKIGDISIAFLGAGAANTTIISLLIQAGANPERIVVVDSRGGLHQGRNDIKADPRYYIKQEICERTNPKRIDNIADALMGADVLIALSTPGPNTIKPEWIHSMGPKSIVFVCANPIPEIYPYAAKEAGAYIIATGRGDFPNQVNNSTGFPGILSGALAVRASEITDEMALAAAYSLAGIAEKKGLNPNYIIPKMDEEGLFPTEAAAVAMQAIKEGVARIEMTSEEVYKKVEANIKRSQAAFHCLMDSGIIERPPERLIVEALKEAIRQVS